MLHWLIRAKSPFFFLQTVSWQLNVLTQNENLNLHQHNRTVADSFHYHRHAGVGNFHFKFWGSHWLSQPHLFICKCCQLECWALCHLLIQGRLLTVVSENLKSDVTDQHDYIKDSWMMISQCGTSRQTQTKILCLPRLSATALSALSCHLHLFSLLVFTFCKIVEMEKYFCI